MLVGSVLDISCFLLLLLYLHHSNYHFLKIRETSFYDSCILDLFQFVKDRSIQDELFWFLKHAGFFTKLDWLSRLDVLQLRSSKISILPSFLRQISRTFLNLYRWLAILVLCALYEEPFFLLIFTSTNRYSILFGNLCSIKCLEGRSCPIQKSIPPPFEVRFSLYGLEKPCIRN